MASARFVPQTLAPATQAIPTMVVRHSGPPSGGGRWTPMLGIRWSQIRWARGPTPPTAVFRHAYIPDDPAPVPFELALPQNPSFPVQFDPEREDIEPAGPESWLRLGDRVGVVGLTPRGALRWMFDGFVVAPEAHISGRNYQIPIQAIGAPIRFFDEPLFGSLWRNADEPDNPEAFRRTGIPARFNPEGRGNATGDPDGDGSWDGITIINGKEFRHPTFIDPLAPPHLPSRPDGWVRKWDLGMGARYILAAGSEVSSVEVPLQVPDDESVDDILKGLVPKSGRPVDPDDPDTFERVPIIAPDRVIAGMPWPVSLWNLIEPLGFAFTWDLEGDSENRPYWRLHFLRERDNLGTLTKSVSLQSPGEVLDVGRSMIRGLGLARDASQVINAYTVQGRPDRAEASFVLVPGFEVREKDNTDRDRWTTSNPDPHADRNKFRLWIADEAGEGFWDQSLAGAEDEENGDGNGDPENGDPYLGDWLIGAPISFDPIFGEEAWVVRRRPGRKSLITLGPDGEPRRAEIALLFDYEKGRGLWDGSGTVVPIKTNFEMLEDRLGIRLTCSDPSEVKISDHAQASVPKELWQFFSGGVIDLVSWLTDEEVIAKAKQRPYFLLTTVIEGDHAVLGDASKRPSCPVDYTVRRYAESRDRFGLEVVHKSSRHFDKENADPDDENFQTWRNDTPAAKAYAESLRSATEMPSVAGGLEVGRLVNAYLIGDRISHIDGRGVSLESNINAEAGEKPRYPTVVGVTWINDGGAQRTVIQLDDLRAEGRTGEGE